MVSDQILPGTLWELESVSHTGYVSNLGKYSYLGGRKKLEET